MVKHYGKFVQDQGMRTKALCGQWAGGFGNNMWVTNKISEVTCKKCLKVMSEDVNLKRINTILDQRRG